MNKIFQSKKTIIIASVALVLVLALVAGLVIWLVGDNDGTHRSITVYEVEGGVEIYRGESAPMTPYTNMSLESGDKIKTLGDGCLYIKLDGDKYLMASPDSCFRLEATGTEQAGKTKLTVESGKVMVHVVNSLSADSEFTVGTGNSTMAIRGTSFSAEYDAESGTSSYDVFEGAVEIGVTDENGVPTGEKKQLSEGYGVDINGEEFGEELPVDYTGLEVNQLQFIQFGIEQGNDMAGITAPELDDLINGPEIYKVTFAVDGNVFAMQMIKSGEKAVVPMLKPAGKGKWDFDFTTPITADVTVNWIADAEA